VGEVSGEVDHISAALAGELSAKLVELDELGRQLVARVRGGRLADLALNMIEIVDRNLYERSCDVRWWATDAAVVDVCTDQAGRRGPEGTGGPEAAAVQQANKRLGVILDSYTVYLDLWVARLDGTVVAHGRPGRHPGVIGHDVSAEPWFANALATRSGEEFTAADVAPSPLLGGRLTAAYATAVRAGGEVHGEPVGVLGILFDWETQADGVVHGVRLAEDERARTRCLLVDSHHRVIASSEGRSTLTTTVSLDTTGGTMGHYARADGTLVGYSLTPGYETYAGMGWYGVIEQRRP
jgi:hypothetical protein